MNLGGVIAGLGPAIHLLEPILIFVVHARVEPACAERGAHKFSASGLRFSILH
jgi:hypothetical protein